jgi:hypothetical protein
VSKALSLRPYNKVLWRIRGEASVVYKSRYPLDGKFMLGFCFGPYIAIHKKAMDQVNVWHHELGHAIINKHYGGHSGAYLNKRENETFACTYENFHWLLFNMPEVKQIPVHAHLSDESLNYVVDEGIKLLDYRMKHGGGKKGYAHLKRYVLRKERLMRAMRYVIRTGMLCDGELPNVDGWLITNPWNNRHRRK